MKSYSTSAPEETKTQFIPCIFWFLLIAWVVRITVFVRRRSGADFADVDVHAGAQIFIVCIMGLLLFFLLPRVLATVKNTARTSLFFLCLYYVVCVGSSLWSPLPTYSFYRGVEFIISLMAVLVSVSYSQSLEKAEKTILLISLIVVVLSIYARFNVFGFSWSLRHWHTNSYSASAAMLLCYCIGEYFIAEKSRKKMLMRYSIFAFAALALGTSSASNIATFFSFILIFFFYRKWGMMVVALWLFFIFASISLYFAGDFTSYFSSILFHGKSTEDVVTLRGRIPMWTAYFIKIFDSPFYGHGFAVLSTGKKAMFASHPHNSIISVLLGTGAFGALMFGIYLIKLTIELIKTAARRLPGAIGCLGAIMAGLVNSLAMPLVGDQYEESSLVFISFSAFFILFVLLPNIRKEMT